MSSRKESSQLWDFSTLSCVKIRPQLALGVFGFVLGSFLNVSTGNLSSHNKSSVESNTVSFDINNVLSGSSAVAAPRRSSGATPGAASAWESKEIRGIYLSRYQVTGSTSEKTIRDRVRYYKAQGINTIIHGVWGNGCPMYNSQVMQETFGIKSCPNAFQENWLDWLIDEAHKNDMQVHAYFEKGIKLDRNSPIYSKAVANKWFVPGVDDTYAGVDHRVLDVNKPEISDFFTEISAEFVQRYPEIDAVQWDDYLGYYAGLPGNVDRTGSLTRFVDRLRDSVKQTNPKVSFDLCHHNPYWGKRYFDADWTNWDADRAFIQAYNDGNFSDEMAIAEDHSGVAITENQLHRLDEILRNEKIQSILIFPSDGDPEAAAGLLRKYTSIR